MGTPNFAHPQNASKYFVVLTSREEEVKLCNDCDTHHHEWEYNLENLNKCEECGSTDLEEKTIYVYPDDHDYECLKDNLKYEFKDKLDAIISETSFNDRNYHRTSIAEIYTSKSYGDIEVEIKFDIIIQSAYYEGATLDYMISIGNGYGFDEVEYNYNEIIEELFEITDSSAHYSDMNKGLRVILSYHAIGWVEDTIAKVSKQIEEIFEMFSEHKLNCVGVASNGEAFYTEAK